MFPKEFNDRRRKDDNPVSLKKILSSKARENEENTSKLTWTWIFPSRLSHFPSIHRGIRERIITSNMASLRRQFTSILFALVLTLQCLALEDAIETVQISFSIWSPVSMDFDIVERVVSNAMRDFFCEETDMVLLNTNLRSACIRRDNEEESGVSEEFKTNMLGFIKQSDPDRSYLLDDPLIVRMAFPSKRNIDLEGTLWLSDYEILQIGTKTSSRARRGNFPDEKTYLEETIQESLDRSIAEGVMNERFGDTNIIIGEYRPQEIDTDPEPVSINNDYVEPARLLRYIGIGILVGTSLIHYLLFELESRYPRPESKLKEIDVEDSQHDDAEYQRGLGTEDGVNQMLEEGRRQTEERIQSSANTV